MVSIPLLRVGIVCDFAEENWPSMDLMGDMLYANLCTNPSISVERIQPSMAWRFSAADGMRSKVGLDADRFLNRFWDYPKFLRRYRDDFDVFHIVDHSYAQLVLDLPSRKTIVTCHDLDTFRCLLAPEHEPRSAPFRAMVRRTLRGLQKAALVVCPSVATRDAVLAHQVTPEERLRVVPLGPHPSCSIQPDTFADHEATRLLGELRPGAPDLLHVGSAVPPRKRIEFLLRIFAEVRKRCALARLIRVGGPFTPAQDSLIDELALRDAIVVLPYLKREVLAAVYRRASMVLLSSEREGFGLPVIEAMACGTPVVASDLPPLREIGGDCVSYCSPLSLDEWTKTISLLLREWRDDPHRWGVRRAAAITQAKRFSWEQYTQNMIKLYREMTDGVNSVIVENLA